MPNTNLNGRTHGDRQQLEFRRAGYLAVHPFAPTVKMDLPEGAEAEREGKYMDKAELAELVFGFVYAVGTDADPVITVLRNYLKQYRYDAAKEFRISDQLRSLDLGISFDVSSPFEERNALMSAGNAACARAKDDSILAVMAINEIASQRSEDEQKRPAAKTRTAHLIRSLKRPEEVHLLRQVYRPGFFLIGIADDDDSQIAYLTKEIGLSEPDARLLIERDRDEQLVHGQRTRETFYLADVFV